MADFPAVPPPSTPLFINSIGIFAAGSTGLSTSANTLASASWGTANLARYIPFSIPFPYFVARVFWGNGSAGGNMDFGIYGVEGARIYSTGSTVQSGTSTLQYVTPSTPFVLPPGQYYFGINNNGTTNRGWTVSGSLNQMRLAGFYQQAVGAVTLPDPATFAAATSTLIPLCGITRTTTGF